MIDAIAVWRTPGTTIVTDGRPVSSAHNETLRGEVVYGQTCSRCGQKQRRRYGRAAERQRAWRKRKKA